MLLPARLARCCRHRCRVSASFSSSSSTPPVGYTPPPPPRKPAASRQDNTPLYNQIAGARRAATERLVLDKHRADLRRKHFPSPGKAVDGVSGSFSTPTGLQPAQPELPELPSNCLRWADYALFADPPKIRPLKSPEEDGNGSFASLLRRSSFVALGDFENRIVTGRIFERFEGNLYVDFGGKFHAVCPAPRVNSVKYVRGAQVLLRLLDPELTSRFLGSERHVTLLEADAVLLGLKPPSGSGEEAVEAAAAAEAEASGYDSESDLVSPLSHRLLELAAEEESAAAVASVYANSGGSGVGRFEDAIVGESVPSDGSGNSGSR